MVLKIDQTQLPRVQALHSCMGALPSGRASFAQSLCDNFRKYGKLSVNQMEWVEKLIVLSAEATAKKESPPQYRQEIPGFKCVEDLLYHAKQFHEFPVIRLITTRGQRIKLRPMTSQRGVKVHVETTRGEVVGEVLDTSYLRFLPDLTDVLNALYEVAANPVQTAILYGKKTGCCCFCGIGLTDKRSVHVGYGPICAENYGLPWGDKGPEVSVDELAQLLEAQNK